MALRLAKTKHLVHPAARYQGGHWLPALRARASRFSSAPDDAGQGVPAFEEICEQAQHAVRVWRPTATAFLPPGLAARVLAWRKDWPEIGVLSWGGYQAAERQRLLLAPSQFLGLTPNAGGAAAQTQGPEPVPEAQAAAWPERNPVAAVQVRGDFLLQALRPSDVVGAVADLGVGAGAVGDVVAVSERGADLFLLPAVVDDVVARLTHIGGRPVSASAVAPCDLASLRVPRRVPVTSVESSLRADAVLGAGLGCGRGQAAALIKAGGVQLDWHPLRKPAAAVEVGATLACEGRGRVRLVAVQPTAKGRMRLALERIA